MSGTFFWNDEAVAFHAGESLAYALFRNGTGAGLFCGIGCCQGCLVTVAGRGSVAGCLTPAEDGMRVSPLEPAALEATDER